MNIDDLEKMDKFPTKIKYIKKELIYFLPYLIPFMAISYMFLDITLIITGTIIFTVFTITYDYVMDKRIFEVFKSRKEKIKKGNN